MLHLVPGDDLVGGGDEVGEGHNLSSLFYFLILFFSGFLCLGLAPPVSDLEVLVCGLLLHGELSRVIFDYRSHWRSDW